MGTINFIVGTFLVVGLSVGSCQKVQSPRIKKTKFEVVEWASPSEGKLVGSVDLTQNGHLKNKLVLGLDGTEGRLPYCRKPGKSSLKIGKAFCDDRSGVALDVTNENLTQKCFFDQRIPEIHPSRQLSLKGCKKAIIVQNVFANNLWVQIQ